MNAGKRSKLGRYAIAKLHATFDLYLVIDLRENKVLRKYDNIRDCRYFIQFTESQLDLFK